MKKTLCCIFILCSLGYAGFFSTPVQFFGSSLTETQPAQNKEIKNKPHVSIWAQPIVMPDGSIQVYVPPPQVIGFLNNPTSRNAKEYLLWEKQRIDKIIKATQILQSVAMGNKPLVPLNPKKNPVISSKPQNNKSTNPFSSPTILYFAKQGCRFCMAEDMVMDMFHKRYKNKVKIIGLWVGSKNSMPKISFPFHLSNGLEKKFRVSLYPSMIFYLPDKPEPVKLEGFVTGNQLIQFYQKIGGRL